MTTSSSNREIIAIEEPVCIPMINLKKENVKIDEEKFISEPDCKQDGMCSCLWLITILLLGSVVTVLYYRHYWQKDMRRETPKSK